MAKSKLPVGAADDTELELLTATLELLFGALELLMGALDGTLDGALDKTTAKLELLRKLELLGTTFALDELAVRLDELGAGALELAILLEDS